jgi:uncharacterized protein (UPF0262 family)
MTTIMRGCRCMMSATAILCLMLFVSSFAGIPARTVAHYKVSSMGLDVGNVTTTQRMTEEAGMASVDFETKTAIKASFLWMGYHQDTIEKGTLQRGELIRYSRKGRENGTTIDILGRLEHSSFRFEVREQGAMRSVVIPRSSYDYTTMECPEARLDFSDKQQVTLRILDVENMAVVKRDYHFVRNTLYSVGGKELPCRIVDFSDRNKKARRWITWDGSAVVMYRQDGKGEKSSYSVQATSIAKEL